MNLKKGFTLAEMLAVLMVIAVIAMMLIPQLKNMTPNQEHLMFRKAYYLMSNTIYELVNDEDLYPEAGDDQNDYLGNVADVFYRNEGPYKGETKFCELVSKRFNTVSDVKCEKMTFTADGQKPVGQFRTNDNMVWILPIDTFSKKDERYPIYVDVNGDKKPNCFYKEKVCDKPDTFTMYVMQDGRLILEGDKEIEYMEKASPTT